jgi:hypothetical protein
MLNPEFGNALFAVAFGKKSPKLSKKSLSWDLLLTQVRLTRRI